MLQEQGRFFLLALLLFLSLIAYAIPLQAAPYRSCTREDLPGTWEMAAQIINTPVKPEDAFYFPYQRYVFSNEGGVKHMTSQEVFTGEHRKMQDAAPAVTTYQLNDKGTLIFKRERSERLEALVCTYVTETKDEKNAKLPKQGDVLLTYFSETNTTEPLLERLLRKTAA